VIGEFIRDINKPDDVHLTDITDITYAPIWWSVQITISDLR